MRANRRRNTGPELALRAALRAAGLLGYRVDLKGVPGRPDIAFTRHKLAVFVHGCFWHRCPSCRLELPKSNRAFWRHKFEANQERDERKRLGLEAIGWGVLEIWECEIERDLARCVARVERAIANAIDSRDDVAEFKVADRPMPRARRKSRGRS